ncbi:MAG TPA: hypothetical protein VLL49_12750 [Anaerolineales bacterium]|nr:hypothetical protein [Anaerolineales bacterium]
MLPTRGQAQALPPPPGIIGSLRAGFDATAAHLGLILLPLGLDLVLWLGPRLGLRSLMQPVVDEIARLGPSTGLPQGDINSVMEMYADLLARFNLLAVLRTLPIGVSSLMSGRMPLRSPLGAPIVFQIDSASQLLGWFMLLTFLGWTLGGLYFLGVAGLAVTKPSSPALATPIHAVIQTILYSLICAVLVWFLGLPALFLVYVAFAINALLGQGLVLFLGFVSLWLLVPLFFSPHGIFVRRQNAFASFLAGFQLTRLTLSTSSLFVASIFLVALGLNVLWGLPQEEEWIALVGLLGHAFITTALLAASFIYYQEMSNWVHTVLARLRSRVPTPAA